jgi:hypothetical protein
MILGEYFENLFKQTGTSKKTKKSTFLDAFGLPKLDRVDINHLNRTIASNEIEAVIESPNNNITAQATMDSLLNYTRPLKKY